jgi:sugar phosphate isomerase/epimerase
MKIGVFTALFGRKTLDETLDIVSSLGLGAIELGTGNYPGAPHVPVDTLLENVKERTEFLAKILGAGLSISALSCHGNPLHPQKKIALAHHDTLRKTVKLAKLLKVDTVVCFSGCPGDHDRAKSPNWVTCTWPTEYAEMLEWQWSKVAVPYWKVEAKHAEQHGVRIALEMHPGFLVYNTATMLALREACGPTIGANFDPSHLFWQGIDPLVSLRALEGAVFHVHAKDTFLDPINFPRNGGLDTTSYTKVKARSWSFRTVGYGHGETFWRDFAATLRLIGYDGVVSIEHEDPLMSTDEGLRRAVEVLRRAVFTEKPETPWWT